MTSGQEDRTAAEPDSEGCLLITASYADVAPVIGSVVADAAARIIMSPALDDFIELRFIDVGPRPDPGAMPAAAVRRVVRELTRPSGGAGRNYFALVIADRSAAAAGQLLRECGADQVVAALPLRCRGLASIDDRPPDFEQDDHVGRAAQVVVSPTGAWSHGNLVAELRRYAEELMRGFAAGLEPGITLSQLDLLRPEDTEPAAVESGTAGDDGEPGSRAAAPAEPDVLRPPEMAAAAESGSTGGGPKPTPQSASPWTPGALSPLEEQTGQARRTRAAAPVAGSSPASAAPGRHSTPWLRWWPSRAAAPRAESPAADPATPRITGLVYLILSSDNAGDRAAWRRGRSVLIEVDSKLAAIPRIAYNVRVLQTPEDAAKGELRPAGRLSWRDVKRPAEGTDLARVMRIVAAVMKRDLAVLESALTEVARPAIVFFAVDAPLADPITAEAHDELARQASITWVVPQSSADLMSPSFGDGSDTRIIFDHRGVADEAITILVRATQQAMPGLSPQSEH